MSKTPLNAQQIRDLLPHRHPMLMIDRVLEIGDEHLIAQKLVSTNEPFFTGHFPKQPIMPGVLILEALAQAAGIWALVTYPDKRGLATALVGIDKARFRRPVLPGDSLSLHVELVRIRGRMFKFQGVARVEGETVAEATFMAAFVEWSDIA